MGEDDMPVSLPRDLRVVKHASVQKRTPGRSLVDANVAA
jgi:hypothetical protein